MVSPQAQALWAAFRSGPKQIDLDLTARRAAGEAAETPTSEPVGVRVVDEPAVRGIWVEPELPRDRAAVLYLFGGGYVLGSPASRRKTAGHLANAARTRVLVPDYRLAPEHPFPAAVDDALAAYRFVIGGDVAPERVVLAGDSAGGGLAFALLLAVREAGDPLPGGVVAMSPWVDLTCTGTSMTTATGVDIMVTRDGLLDMASQYLAGHDATDPLASPLFGELGGLPPVLVLVGGDEALLDDAARLVTRAGATGTDAQLIIGARMQHVWPTWCGALPEADAAMAAIGAWIDTGLAASTPPR